MKTRAITKNKINSHLFILSLAMLNIIITFDDYMYFAASPQIISYFHIEIPQINNISKANFIGIIFGSLLISTIINKYKKKHLLLSAMVVFIISKITCLISTNFNVVIFCSLIGGIANSFPPTLIVLLLLQRYSDNLTNNKLLTLDIIAYTASLIMPMVTEFLINHYSWRMSFIFPSFLGLISLIITYNFVCDIETPSQNDDSKISIKDISIRYLSLIKNLKFITFVFIACLPWITETLRLVSIPILLNDLHISLLKFSFAKEFFTIINIICAFITIKLIKKKGLIFTTNFGFVSLILGAILFTLACYYQNLRFLLFATVIILAGENLVVGFIVRAISSLPKINQGIASSFIVIVSSFLSIRATTLSQNFYNHKILPNALLMIWYVAIAIILFTIVYYRDKKKKITK